MHSYVVYSDFSDDIPKTRSKMNISCFFNNLWISSIFEFFEWEWYLMFVPFLGPNKGNFRATGGGTEWHSKNRPLAPTGMATWSTIYLIIVLNGTHLKLIINGLGRDDRNFLGSKNRIVKVKKEMLKYIRNGYQNVSNFYQVTPFETIIKLLF